MLDVVNDNQMRPVNLALDNEYPVFNYIMENSIITNASIHLVNSCIMKKINNEVIMKLVSQLDDINVFSNDNMSPMFCAIRMENIELIDYLITRNYNMEMKSAQNFNAFHYAVRYGTPKMVMFVLDMCPNLEEDTVDGWRIVHICAYYGMFDSIMYLLEKFVNLTIPIVRFKGENKEYLPINLVEINANLKDDERQTLIDYMIQLMELQL
jgi:ankyrin repeat protein